MKDQYSSGFPVVDVDSTGLRQIAYLTDLFGSDPGNDASAGYFCVPDGDLGKMDCIFPFGKDYLRHSTPEFPPGIHAREFPQAFEPQAFYLFSGRLEGDLPVPVTDEKILKGFI